MHTTDRLMMLNRVSSIDMVVLLRVSFICIVAY